MTDPFPDENKKPAPRVNWSEDDIRDVLRNVVDPELHMNIVDLGLVYEVKKKEATALVNMTLTSSRSRPRCSGSGS